MSYKFDFDNPNQEPMYSPINFEVPRTMKNKRSAKNYILSGLIGGLIGAILISIILVSYFNTNISNLKNEINSNLSSISVTPTSTQSTVTKTVVLNSGDSSFVTEVAKKVGPAVVGIKNKATAFNWRTNQSQEITAGEGSGVIISKDGYIVTNYHVVQNADSISVILSGEKEVNASIVGADQLSDIAVIKIDPKYVTAVATLGDSSKVQVGEFVVAIGNPLGQEFAGSVTFGVISAVNRKIDTGNGVQIPLLQTDAAINPGNSGGALVNSSGQVIGINSAKIAQSGVEGMGFAIPSNYVKPIVNDLIKYKKVQRPTIGVSLQEYYDMFGNPVGIEIEKVFAGTGAAAAGLKEGDWIIEVDNKKVSSFNDVQNILAQHKIGDKIQIKVRRDGVEKTFTVTLGKPVDTNQ